MKNNILNRKLRYKYALLAISCALLTTSCVKEDLLDRKDPTSVDDSKAWTSPYLTKLGMNGVYAGLKLNKSKTGEASTNREVYQFDQFGTGQSTANSDVSNLLFGGTSTSSNVFIYIWRDLYEAVYRANDAIVNIPVKSQCDDATKATYMAEAKFLRAFAYFRLNQLFKGVPLYEVPTTMEDCTRPRSTEQQVWDFILNDLNDCISEPRLPNKQKKGTDDYGRISKGAAYALRGKVYMYLKDWDKAIADFDEVANCGFSLFSGNYADLFTAANEQSDEMVFSIQEKKMENYGSTMHFIYGVRSSSGSCWNQLLPSARAVDLYENIDGSPFDWDDYIPGYKNMASADREVYFLRDTLGITQELIANTNFPSATDAINAAKAIRNKVEERLRALPNSKNLYLPKGNEARLRQAYDNRDPRLEASVMLPYSKYLGQLGSVEDYLFTMRWPFYADIKGVDDLKTNSTNYNYYIYRKFVLTGNALVYSERTDSPIDQPLIRYADVLLMKAEAYAMLAKTTEAVNCINDVRRRAGVALLNSSPATTVQGADDLMNRIRHERRVELLGEGASYFDELRWGTYKDFVFSVDKSGNLPGRQFAHGSVQRAYSYESDKTLTWPIPASEIEYNSNLIQNSGW